jgi:hypothetical protein
MDALIVETTAPDAEHAGSAAVSLEAAELELALQMQNILEQGFEGALRRALAELGGTLLFDMPASLLDGFQRVAAVSTGSGEDRRIFLVHLGNDGAAINVEEAESDNTPLAGFAASYVNLMERLAA